MSDEIKKCEECGEIKYVSFRSEYNQYLCTKHNQQMLRHGKIQPERKKEEKRCDVCGDTKYVSFRTAYNQNLCAKHYQQMIRHGKIQAEGKIMKVCDICGNSRLAHFRKAYKQNLCGKHYKQMITYGEIQADKEKKCDICGDTKYTTFRKRFNQRLCEKHNKEMVAHGVHAERVKKCDVCGETKRTSFRKAYNQTLCGKHNQQMITHGQIQIYRAKKCDVCGDTKKITKSHTYKMDLCRRHYSQMIEYGYIREYTIRDKNEIIVEGEFSYILLRNRQHKEVARTSIDTEDVEKLKRHKWTYNARTGYVYTTISGETHLIHRIIKNYKGELQIDHINRNKLDNRKENLRIATARENSQNAGLSKRNSSGFTGVFPYKEVWKAAITHNNTQIRLGTYTNKEDAVRARLEAEKKYFGKFASQRHLFPKYNIA